MSAEATGWVFRESPYTGAMFTLHLALADIVNDTYGNELWMSAPTLAEKARLCERTVRSGLAQMVADGLLIVVAERPGTTRRYRFAMPADPCTTCTPAIDAPLQTNAQTPANDDRTPATDSRTPALVAPNPKITQENPTEPKKVSAKLAVVAPSDAAFAEFWRCYPMRKAKGAARVAFEKALKRAKAEQIITGALTYANDPHRDPDFTKHPATWLNSDCWDDEPAAPRPRLSKGTLANLAWAERTS